MSILNLPSELTKKILSCLAIKDLYRCMCACWSWNKLIGREFIIIEIFLRLPVKSLLRFKSVSKYCYILLSDLDFVRLHHKYQARLNPSVIAIDEDSMYSARLNPNVIVLDETSTYNDHDATKLDYPEEIDTFYVSKQFIGSCKGLLCFYCQQHNFLLYNPATGAFSMVPSYPRNSYTSGWKPGFGYDSKEEDYKIVTCERDQKAVFIYSLKNNSWRKTTSSNPCGSRNYFGTVFLNNAFHWIYNRQIMSFELSSEQYHELPMPKLKARTFWNIQLSALDGSHLHLLQHFHGRMDLWIMKEYGVKYSWAKLFSITNEGFDSRQFWDPLPIAYLKGRSQILLGSTEKPEEPVDFMSYDFKTRKLEKLEVFDGLPRIFRARDPGELPNESVPIVVAQWAESLFPLQCLHDSDVRGEQDQVDNDT